MSRFIIVTLPPTPAEAAQPFGRTGDSGSEPLAADCTWLFSASSTVDDAEGALRSAVREFFASREGARVREGEGLQQIGWCDAIPWVPEEIWERHGLTVFRHPDVERILLDPEEDLAEEMQGVGVAASGQPDDRVA